MDEVFKALADPGRRRLLDSLNARGGQTLSELCSVLDMARQSVSKHLDVLEDAELVVTVWRGREKLHYLNAAPISEISDRWINQYHRRRVSALAGLKRALEDPTMESPEFVYVTYIQSTPERVWEALTDPKFTARYWGRTYDTDWKKGSRYGLTQSGVRIDDPEQLILEADPPRRLSYTWHTVSPELAQAFGWSDEFFAACRGRASFEGDIRDRSRVGRQGPPHGHPRGIRRRQRDAREHQRRLAACARQPQDIPGDWRVRDLVGGEMTARATDARTAGSAAVVATLGLSAASWVLAVRQMNGMGRVTGLGSLAFFAGLWVSMMAAMMLPGRRPGGVEPCSGERPVARRARLRRVISRRSGRWSASPCTRCTGHHSSFAVGLIAVAAGVYELTPVKQHFRRRCLERDGSGLVSGSAAWDRASG